jgi:hypothetical protein
MALDRDKSRGGQTVRKLVLYFCFAGLALGQTPQPNDTVLAWKPQTPYMHGESGWPSMSHNLWTNSVLWFTAESPVLNEGATNANWICYAKTCAGNATQLDPNKQPLRVLTNGVWVLRFDRTDDFIMAPSFTISSNSNFTVIASFRPKSFSDWQNPFDSDLPNGFRIEINSSGALIVRWFGAVIAGNASWPPIQVLATNTVYHFAMTKSGNNFQTYLNKSVWNSGTLPSSKNVFSALNIGRGFSTDLDRLFDGDVFKFIVFDRALTTNEIWSLSE